MVRRHLSAPVPPSALRSLRSGTCAQCGCRRGWPSLHVVFCSACGRGQRRASRARPAPREVLLFHDELPPLRVPLRWWQRAVRVRTFGTPTSKTGSNRK
jgi:hypothetical protein